MRRLIQRIARLVCAVTLLSGVGSSLSAQVNFAVLPVVVEGEITPEAGKVVYDKTVQILTRNSAAAAGNADVFAVEASLSVGDKSQTSGMVRDVTSISGELTLVAVNKVDHSRYYSVTVPLKAVTKGSESSPVLALAKSVKPTDAVYTRFVRLAREKVEEYYSDHCSEVLGRAQTLVASGQTALAMVYLTGVPPSAPCHEEVVEYIAACRGKLDRDIAAAEVKEEERREREWQHRKELNGMSGPEGSADDEPSGSGAKPMQNMGDVEIYVEDPNWKFNLLKAEYLASARKVKIIASLEYVGKKSLRGECVLGFRQAVDGEGNNFGRCYVEGSKYRSFPDGVPVKIEYFIEDVKTNPKVIKFIGLSIDYKKIEIRNLQLSE